MDSKAAKKFIEGWFQKVWVNSSIEQLKLLYDEEVQVTANGAQYDRKGLIKHCEWCKANEKISSVDYLDIVAEGRVIAFRLKYQYSNEDNLALEGENIGIMHLNREHKIIQIDVKSSEEFNN